MFRILKHAPAALALTLIIFSASFAQQPNATATPKPESDSSVTEKFKNKIFEVKFRDPGSLVNVLYHLGSGFKGATISASTEFKTITVRDFPENLAIIEEAIKRLDTPATPRPNIELHMHVLVASNTGGSTADVPAELKDVLTQLHGTFNYRNYELATSVVQRLTETNHGLRGKGTAEFSGALSGAPPAQNTALPYEYMISGVSLAQNPSGATTVQINQFSFLTLTVNPAQVETALSLRDGEKVVVGTATLRDRALIIVLSAKLIN